MRQIYRFIEDKVVQSLKAFPAVYIAGPRQSGKTTLVQHIASKRHRANYITFDDILMQSAAKRDPETFLRQLDGPYVLDEIQMVPELFRPLKMIIDENRQRTDGGLGQFLLTGSASVMALPQLSDALVGRLSLHTLLPFSALEISGSESGTFIDRAFLKDWKIKKTADYSVDEMMNKASFPELSTMNDQSLRYEWCNGYIRTILQRDVRLLMEIEKIGQLPDMLRLLAARTSGLLNESSLSRDLSLNHVTLKKYRVLLESLFLLLPIPAWSKNIGKKLIKSPKTFINDINIIAYLLNIDFDSVRLNNPVLYGRIIENFVALELVKQLNYSTLRAQCFHYRSVSKQEIDFIIEGPDEKIIGIEVKSNSKPNKGDFRHLEVLKQELGERFVGGYVLYLGRDQVPFGADMWALPVESLWV